MSKKSEAVKDYKHRLRGTLKFIRGNECLCCGSDYELEFAHKEPDDMNGQGRGSYKRYIYIKNHPTKFLLMCHDCHTEFDRTGIPPI